MRWKNITKLFKRKADAELMQVLDEARIASRDEVLRLIEELEVDECDCPVDHKISHWPDALPSLRMMPVERKEE